jgi:hypothetical protein
MQLLAEEFMHRTNRGDLVRSKSEEIIANKLHARGIDYAYEQPLCMVTGRTRFPDFTITDHGRGITYYWEHLRTLADPAYRQICDRNHSKYLAAGIRPWQEGGGSNGILIETRDEPDGGVDAAMIDKLIDEVLLKFTNR